MKRTRKIISLLAAAVLAVCMIPAGTAESAPESKGIVFTIETEETSSWNTTGSAAEWDALLEATRREGLATPVSELDLLEADPEAKVERQNGRIFMIQCRGLGNLNSIPDAYRAAYRLLRLLGGSGDITLRLTSVITINETKVYLFQHVFEGLTVVGSTVKLVTDSQGRIIAVFSSLSAGNPEATGTEPVTAAMAEDAVRGKLKEQGFPDSVLPEYTFRAVLPADFDIDGEDSPPDRLVWVVFSANPAFTEGKGSDLPFLAHYVDTAGTYLHSTSVSIPGDRAARTGYAADYTFAGMETEMLAGTASDSEGNSFEYNVPVMKKPGTELWYLGDPERKIALAEFKPMIYGENREVKLVSSETRDGWDPKDLQAYGNMISIWDYYAAMGWKGPDGCGTPVLLMRGMCKEDGEPIENACYAGQIDGWQCFCYGGEMNLPAALDVMSHEYTHCVTTSTMNSNLYEDDYGAINEAMSDIMGNLCESLSGATQDKTWLLGESSGSPIRSMTEPHLFGQPEYVWDIYYVPGTEQPNDINDRGGVHFNSSILNYVAAQLCEEGGMTLEEAAGFWLTVACVLTPRTDYFQMASLLPWALQVSGNGKYADKLQDLIVRTRMAEEGLPERLAEGQRLVTLKLPDNEAFDDPYWFLLAVQLDTDTLLGLAKAGADYLLSLVLGTEFDSTELVSLLASLGISPETFETEQGNDDMILNRIKERLISQHFSWISSGENREIRAVLKQQTTVYALVNLDPDSTNIRSVLLLIDGEWVDFSNLFILPESGEAGPDQLLTEENIHFFFRVLGRIPALLAKQDPSVKWIDLPVAGLEQVQLKPLEE